MRLHEINKALCSLAEQLDNKPDGIRDTIIRFFKEHQTIEDSEIHALADKLGIEHSEFEKQVYSVLKDILSGKFFKHWNAPDSKFDPKELAMGVNVEKEHTDNPEWAKIIAKAHLTELPNYYTLLDAMEKEGKKQKMEMRRIRK
jgi:hypothetical protein